MDAELKRAADEAQRHQQELFIAAIKEGKELIQYRGNWYWKGEQGIVGQGDMTLPDGTPIKYIVWFVSEGHACGR